MVKVKASELPSYSLHVKVLTVVDVSIKAESFEEAVRLGKELKTSDLVSYEERVSEYDSKTSLLSITSPEDWGV